MAITVRYQLIIDPEFQALAPPLLKNEYRQLEKNILRDGCREPISIWNNTILDGHNRYAICLGHNLPFQVTNVNLVDRDDALSWICANQIGRRNITEETRRYLIGKRYEAEKRIGARNAEGSNQYVTLSPTMLGKAQPDVGKYGASARIGKEYRLSHATVEKYGRYAKAVDRIGGVERRLVPQILAGIVQVSLDNILGLSRLSDQQIKDVASTIREGERIHLEAEEIIEALKQSSSAPLTPTIIEQRSITIKDMPMYDPDAEITSLALTIPSWCSSIERVQSTADFHTVSGNAKYKLYSQLISLQTVTNAMLAEIEEG